MDIIDNDFLRRLFTCFRLSAHSLAIESGRYNGAERINRICQQCNSNMVESEYHFLLICNKHNDLRKKYLSKSTWPNLAKFNKMMSTHNKNLLNNICRFIKEAYTRRT